MPNFPPFTDEIPMALAPSSVAIDIEDTTNLPAAATGNNMESMQPNVTMLAAHASYLFLQLAPMGTLPVTHFGNVPKIMTVLPAALHVAIDVEGITDLAATATSINMEIMQPNITMPAAHASYLFLQLAPTGAMPVTPSIKGQGGLWGIFVSK